MPLPLRSFALASFFATALVHAADGQLSAAATAGWIPDFSLDSGGKASATIWQASVSGSKQLDPQQRLGLAMGFGQQSWSFEQATAWGGVSPWKTLGRATLSMPYSYATGGGWVYAIAPGVEYAAESGASQSDSLSYGVSVSAAHYFAPDRMVGLGVAVWQRLESTEAFPFLVVNWKLADQWRLANPFAVSPVGPAGLELTWMPAPRFELGFGGTWRSYEYRLASNNRLAANGVMQDKTVPLFVRAGYAINDSMRLDAYAGAGVGGEFVIQNANGDDVSTEKHSAMPILGLTLSGRF